MNQQNVQMWYLKIVNLLSHNKFKFMVLVITPYCTYSSAKIAKIKMLQILNDEF